MIPDQLTKGQFDSVNNLLSLATAALLFTAIYLLAAQPRVLPRYRQALVVGAIVCGIASYNYFRILRFVPGSVRQQRRRRERYLHAGARGVVQRGLPLR